MDEISLKGENYVKASVLGRKFGYTADYVGQLCRAGHVKATLVGRSWYVTEESLLEHKKGRYRSSLAKSKEMVRKYAEVQRQMPRTTNVKRIVRYEEDEGELMPALRAREVIPPVEEEVFIQEPEAEEVPLVEEDEFKVEIKHSAPVRHAHSEQIEQRRYVPAPRANRLPPVRTIPAFAVPEIALNRPVRTPVQYSEPAGLPIKGTYKRSMVPALAISLLFVEVLLMTVILGMEKQMTVREDGSGVIMYDFEPELVAASIKSLMK